MGYVETFGRMEEMVVLEWVRVGLEVRKVVGQVGQLLELDGGERGGALTVFGVLGSEVGSFRLSHVHLWLVVVYAVTGEGRIEKKKTETKRRKHNTSFEYGARTFDTTRRVTLPHWL